MSSLIAKYTPLGGRGEGQTLLSPWILTQALQPPPDTDCASRSSAPSQAPALTAGQYTERTTCLEKNEPLVWKTRLIQKMMTLIYDPPTPQKIYLSVAEGPIKDLLFHPPAEILVLLSSDILGIL